MPFRSKRFQKAVDGVSKDPQPLADAVSLVKARASARFTDRKSTRLNSSHYS